MLSFVLLNNVCKRESWRGVVGLLPFNPTNEGEVSWSVVSDGVLAALVKDD
jgi:hypothetical protein